MLQFNLNFLYTIINLIILVFLLKKFLIKPVNNVMEKRKEMIADGFKKAEDAQNDAMNLKKQYTDALSGAKEESARIVAQAREEAKAEYDQVMKKANEDAEVLMTSAKANIRMEQEQTMNALQSQIAGLAMTAAQKIVEEKAGQMKDNQTIYDEMLEEVGEDAHGSDTEK